MPTTERSTQPRPGSYTEHLEDEVLRLERKLDWAERRIAELLRHAVRIVPSPAAPPPPVNTEPPVWRAATHEIVWGSLRCAFTGRTAAVMATLMSPPGQWRSSTQIAAMLGGRPQPIRAVVHRIRVQLAKTGIDPRFVLESRASRVGGVRALIAPEAAP